MRGLRFLAAALALLPATQAAAQTTPAPASTLFGWSGSWEIRQLRGICTLTHTDKDAAATEIVIARATRGRPRISVHAAGWPAGTGSYETLTLEEGGFVITGGAAYPGQSEGRNGFTLTLYKDEDLTNLFAARRIIVRANPAVLHDRSFTMPPSGMAMADLDRCVADARTRESGTGAVAMTPPRLRGKQEDLMTSDDYPAAAVRSQTSGTVTVRVTVTAYGQISDCKVTAPSGSDVLDKATCGIYSRRARFEPALDAEGQPTLGHYDFTKQWIAPPPPPF